MTPPVLVTGAPGWLGTRLVQALVSGIPEVPAFRDGWGQGPVRCLAHRPLNFTALTSISPRIEMVKGDLTDPASLAEFMKDARGAVLFHCAGLIHPRRVRELYRVNVAGTENLMAAAVGAGVKRIVYVSSSAVCGQNPDPAAPFDESAPYRPFMNYGRSKRMAEEIVKSRGEAGGIETVVARAPWFHGPGQPARQNRFFAAIKNGGFPIVGNGTNKRSMVCVDNLCQGLILCAGAERAAGRTYWIADREPYTMNEIIDTVERAMRDSGIAVSGKRLHLPGVVSGLALLADRTIQGAGWHVPEVHVLAELGRNIFCSVSRAMDELGYQPSADLYTGTIRALQWLRENNITI
ncbi:MAG TPA: NAD(P)-dependent oxidoreductase [bacterium]|nr:NAD(P)-dependent oxidoreductase [bacterium]